MESNGARLGVTVANREVVSFDLSEPRQRPETLIYARRRRHLPHHISWRVIELRGVHPLFGESFHQALGGLLHFGIPCGSKGMRLNTLSSGFGVAQFIVWSRVDGTSHI
jgi:hypothetical protein